MCALLPRLRRSRPARVDAQRSSLRPKEDTDADGDVCKEEISFTGKSEYWCK